MVFAVQCPNPKCRKFMLIEERDHDKEVVCLVCKTPFRIGSERSQLAEENDKEPRTQ